MDQILGFVEQLLNYLKEGEAADIVGMVKDSGIFDVIVEFFKGLFA